jgi:hypothetical protein
VETQTPNPLVLSLPDELVEVVAQRAAEIALAAQSEPADEWLDVQAAADYLKCGKRRIYNLVSEGRIPVHRPTDCVKKTSNANVARVFLGVVGIG